MVQIHLNPNSPEVRRHSRACPPLGWFDAPFPMPRQRAGRGEKPESIGNRPRSPVVRVARLIGDRVVGGENSALTPLVRMFAGLTRTWAVRDEHRLTAVVRFLTPSTNFSRMPCANCDTSLGTARRRSFPTVSSTRYFVCRDCGKAQRPTPKLRPAPRVLARARGAAMLTEKILTIARRAKFRILVWGPNPTADTPAARKRHQVREALIVEGHTVHFSEELGLDSGSGVPTNVQEMLQAGQVNLVVNIADSPGSLGEAHEFGAVLGPRMLLWLPEGAKRAFAGTGLAKLRRTAGGATEYYGDPDLSSCVVALASVDWVREQQALSAMAKSYQQLYRALDPSEPIGG